MLSNNRKQSTTNNTKMVFMMEFLTIIIETKLSFKTNQLDMIARVRANIQ